jgi:type VI secretion system protein ImpF
VLAPLFDRLINSGEPVHAQEPFRHYDLPQTLLSIRRELIRLLNTRVPPTLPKPPDAPSTVIDYGIPDFSHLSAADSRDRAELATLIAAKITAFEPRLRQVRVTLEPHRSRPDVLSGWMEAHLSMGLLAEPVSFEMELHASSGARTLDQIPAQGASA